MVATNLTAKQRIFIHEYRVDRNATQAAIRAGYSEATAYSQGQRLLKNVEVGEAIGIADSEYLESIGVNANKVLEEYARIAFSDMNNYLKFSDDGNVYLDWDSMPEQATRAISEITQEEYVEGKGEFARDVKRTKFKLHNKLTALDALAKYLRLFPDPKQEINIDNRRIEIEVTYGDGKEVPDTPQAAPRQAIPDKIIDG